MLTGVRKSSFMNINYEQFYAFKNLDRTQIQKFVSTCKGVIIPAERKILLQNEHGNKIFFLLDGEVRVFLDTPVGEKELSRSKAPTVLGEISFFSGEPNSANVATVTQVKAMIMPFEVLRQRLREGDAVYSIVMLNIAGAIAQRAYAMTRKISELYGQQTETQLSAIQNTSKNLFGEWSFL
ncbi:MAG TPA: hypothetical protein DDZ80_18935 [Cyanobacteria bacterium UBA8803]|nr:hypothetical protein [Cyanobacteria bacterium UBA9273]HBL60451.1 hypothetical protein [Cyanobacteria bacterium UBA8803]